MAANLKSSRVISGMRPTGKLHLGHYYGVLANWLKIQTKYNCYFFVADWHALTTHYDKARELSGYVHEMVIDWLAAGVDPEKSVLFVQSLVPETAELALLLGMITPLSWLERIPTYKDQLRELAHTELATYGFLGYPLLQSADILLYRPDLVPVGEDQLSHLEFCREIARRFNFIYGQELAPDLHEKILVEPQALLTENSKMVGLDGRKMSKSYHNTIGLREDPKSTTQKMRTMPTDPARIRRSDPGEPEKCPVWQWHKVYSDQTTCAWVQDGCRNAKIGCLDCKQSVLDKVLLQQQEFIERAQPWENQPQKIEKIIHDGAAEARSVAKTTLHEVKEALGLHAS